LPSNEDAERITIGSVLIDESLMAIVADELKAGDFYSPLNRRVYAAMLNLFDAHKPIDAVNIVEEMKKESSADSIGGASVISNFAHGLPYLSVKDGDWVRGYCRLVRSKSRVRALISTCNQIIAAAASDSEDAEVVISQSQAAINTVCAQDESNGFSTIGDLSVQALNKIISLRNGDIQASGVQTGLRRIDLVTGGFQPSDLIIIAGRPGMGKSSFAGQVAIGACRIKPEIVVAIFSLEMSEEQYTDRLMSSLASVDLMKMRTGNVNESELERLASASVRLNNYNIVIDDSGAVNAAQIRAKALKLKHEKGRVDAVIVDYLQRMVASKKTEGRQNEVSTIARELKSLAKDLNVPVIALSSLSRECEKRNPPIPRMSDLRDSGDIESEADFVAFLYRANYYNENAPSSIADFIIDKHRHGPTETITLNYMREFTQFGNYQ
jgi:replicative DNA helicase